MSLKEKKEANKLIKANIRKKDTEKKETLINIIRDYPEVWDKADINYRDREIQNVKWEKIAAEIQLTIKEAKCMWKYLKDQFRTNFHAVSSKKSGQEYVADEDIDLVKWPFFKQLMFLKDVVTRRDTFSNMVANTEDDGEEANAIFSEIGFEEMVQEPIDINAPSTSTHSNEPQTMPQSKEPQTMPQSKERQTMPQSKSPQLSRNKNSKPSKKRKLSNDSDDDEIADEILKVDKFLAASIKHKCEKHLENRSQRFCKYLADLLVLVDEGLQRECEAKLLSVVDDYIAKSTDKSS